MNGKIDMKEKKGQAAIEYLMNYGWAILVISIVLVLLYFFIQSPMKVEQCNIQTGFMCNDPVPQIFSVATGADAGTVQMNVRLYNKQQQPIKVSEIVCTSGTEGDANITQALAFTPAITIQPGTSYDFKVSSSQAVPCYVKATATKVKLSAGQDFRGYVAIWYVYENEVDDSLKRTVTAMVSGTIRAQ